MDTPTAALVLSLTVALALTVLAGVLAAALCWTWARCLGRGRELAALAGRLRKAERTCRRLDRALAAFVDHIGLKITENGEVSRKGVS